MAIQLTESAAEHVRAMLAKHEGSPGLRLGIRKSGCSGYAYTVEYVDVIGAADTVFESHGIRVVVDASSLPRLDGMTVDYVRNGLLGGELQFINPNVSSSCGCGESIAFGETA